MAKKKLMIELAETWQEYCETHCLNQNHKKTRDAEFHYWLGVLVNQEKEHQSKEDLIRVYMSSGRSPSRELLDIQY